MASKRSNQRSSGNTNQKLPMNKAIPFWELACSSNVCWKHHCTNYCCWSFWSDT